ncbi:MAG: hypothetical protein ABMA01_20780, partial [Chthoniobacteraceae bacterium]
MPLSPARVQIQAAIAGVLIMCAACSPKPQADDGGAMAIPPRLWEEFSGAKAFEEVARQVAFGPRPSGSAAIEKARDHIAATLGKNGWEVERQEFEVAPVPGQGGIRFVNLVARFSAGTAKPVPRNT